MSDPPFNRRVFVRVGHEVHAFACAPGVVELTDVDDAIARIVELAREHPVELSIELLLGPGGEAELARRRLDDLRERLLARGVPADRITTAVL